MSSYEEENRKKQRICPTSTKQRVAVSMPIAIIPYASVDHIHLHCDKNAIINNNETQCKGKKDGICYFTVSQSFTVEIPVNFGANISTGDTFVECLGNVDVSREDCGCE